MRSKVRHMRALVVVCVVGLLGGLVAGVGGSAGAQSSVRGFDGSTIKVASYGYASQFANVPLGVQARIKRFNDDNEIKGVQIKWTEFADTKTDSALAVSEARRLVAQEGIFAIVGDYSLNNPADYFKQQQVPYFGWAVDPTFCSPKPSTGVWGFGFNGCIGNEDPAWVADTQRVSYNYVSKATGKKHPTLHIVGSDSAQSKRTDNLVKIAAEGVGYDVVSSQEKLTSGTVSDYTPYVQEALTSANGKAPDSITCALTLDCIGFWTLLKASGYKGTFVSGFYADAIVKPMAGSFGTGAWVNPSESNPGMDQFKADLDAVQAGGSAKADTGSISAYAATDMFIQALKTVAKKGKSNITPANVQKAAANQTWQIKGLAGPTVYPKSTVQGYPWCFTLFQSDGTKWSTAEPFTCSKKTYPVK
jgi:ABC-type branched-subunit amino acid transport system substrate-binding protein